MEDWNMLSAKQTTSSAPGKLMLFGEHAVVFNHPCIVTAVDQRIYAQVELNESGKLELVSPQLTYTRDLGNLGSPADHPKEAQFVVEAVKLFTSKHMLAGIKIETHNSFSSQFGFGSSSAVTVAVLHALHTITEVSITKNELFSMAYQCVLNVQGLGSGFDLAAAIWGGTLFFVTGGKTIEPIVCPSLPLKVAYTGVKADTVTLVKGVAELKKTYPEVVEHLLMSVQSIVLQAKESIHNNNWDKVSQLMNINQGILESLGVSTPLIRQLSDSLKQKGASGVKLSGAGGGDCLIVLQDSDSQTLQDPSLIDVALQAEGVKTET